MKLKRGLLYAGAIIVLSLLIQFGVLPLLEPLFDGIRAMWWIEWIMTGFVTLLVAKWYFKQDEPTLVKGIKLGILPAILLAALPMWYSDLWGVGLPYWKVYVTPIIVFVLTAYAGFEFDQTYTKREQ